MTKMTVAQFRAMQGQPSHKGTTRERKPNKYGAQKTTVDGIRFDSRREAKRYGELQNLQRAGVISDLDLQVRIPLEGRRGPLRGKSGRALVYVADFVYTDVATGQRVIEDAKGKKTRDYLLKKAILAAQGVEIVEV